MPGELEGDDVEAGDEAEVTDVCGKHGVANVQGRRTDQEVHKGNVLALRGLFAADSTGNLRYLGCVGDDRNLTKKVSEELLAPSATLRIKRHDAGRSIAPYRQWPRERLVHPRSPAAHSPSVAAPFAVFALRRSQPLSLGRFPWVSEKLILMRADDLFHIVTKLIVQQDIAGIRLHRSDDLGDPTGSV